MSATHLPLHFDTDSPERAWPPFMDWMRAQGVDPHEVRSVTVRLDMTAVLYGYDRDGHRVVDQSIDEPCTYVRSGVIDSMPPLHPSRRRRFGWLRDRIGRR